MSPGTLGPPHHAHHRRGGEVFLAGEMLVEAGLGDADGRSDLVDRHRVEALLGQQAVDALDDRLLARSQHLLLERSECRNTDQSFTD
jgi:hypothetical protein